MSSQRFQQLPDRLRSARAAARLSQKALALAVGIDQSRLCGLEKGRLLLVDTELERRLLEAMNCTDACRSLIRNAAQHDRVMASLEDEGVGEAILRVVSASISAAVQLSDLERTGLIHHLAAIARSKQILSSTLALTSDRHEEATMP